MLITYLVECLGLKKPNFLENFYCYDDYRGPLVKRRLNKILKK